MKLRTFLPVVATLLALTSCKKAPEPGIVSIHYAPDMKTQQVFFQEAPEKTSWKAGLPSEARQEVDRFNRENPEFVVVSFIYFEEATILGSRGTQSAFILGAPRQWFTEIPEIEIIIE